MIKLISDARKEFVTPINAKKARFTIAILNLNIMEPTIYVSEELLYSHLKY